MANITNFKSKNKGKNKKKMRLIAQTKLKKIKTKEKIGSLKNLKKEVLI